MGKSCSVYSFSVLHSSLGGRQDRHFRSRIESGFVMHVNTAQMSLRTWSSEWGIVNYSVEKNQCLLWVKEQRKSSHSMKISVQIGLFSGAFPHCIQNYLLGFCFHNTQHDPTLYYVKKFYCSSPLHF